MNSLIPSQIIDTAKAVQLRHGVFGFGVIIGIADLLYSYRKPSWEIAKSGTVFSYIGGTEREIANFFEVVKYAVSQNIFTIDTIHNVRYYHYPALQRIFQEESTEKLEQRFNGFLGSLKKYGQPKGRVVKNEVVKPVDPGSRRLAKVNKKQYLVAAGLLEEFNRLHNKEILQDSKNMFTLLELLKSYGENNLRKVVENSSTWEKKYISFNSVFVKNFSYLLSLQSEDIYTPGNEEKYKKALSQLQALYKERAKRDLNEVEKEKITALERIIEEIKKC